MPLRAASLATFLVLLAGACASEQVSGPPVLASAVSPAVGRYAFESERLAGTLVIEESGPQALLVRWELPTGAIGPLLAPYREPGGADARGVPLASGYAVPTDTGAFGTWSTYTLRPDASPSSLVCQAVSMGTHPSGWGMAAWTSWCRARYLGT